MKLWKNIKTTSKFFLHCENYGKKGIDFNSWIKDFHIYFVSEDDRQVKTIVLYGNSDCTDEINSSAKEALIKVCVA